MKVLMITGDKRFGPGHPRYELQKSAVEQLDVLYWGRGALWPQVPPGHFDVVTAQDPFWRGLFAWRTARRLGAKFNVQVHTSMLTVLGRFILRRADSVRVVSETIKNKVVAAGVKVPISVLPVFVDLERFKNIVPVAHGQKTILWIGRFESEKDPLFALEVFKQVHAQANAKLVMLGEGSLRQALHEAARALPVTFPGWQDPVDYLAQADVVVSTSWHESWGQSIVEALAAGVPVVAPDVGVAREAGAVVVPKPELASAVIQVLQSGTKGVLKITTLNAEEWARAWAASLM